MSVPPFPPAVKWIMIVTVAIWFIGQVLLEGYLGVPLTEYFSLQPGQVLFDYSVWQLVTYIFLHSQTQVTHIVFNMLMLWFMGAELETRWGTKSFVMYYIINGVGAALIYILGVALYAYFSGSQRALAIPVVGASGSLFALMLAYGWLFGDRIIYFFMVFPMKARYFVMILGFIQVSSLLTTGVAGGEVAHLAHLGGIISGIVYILLWGFYKTRQQETKLSKKKGNLRLIVNNDGDDGSKKRDPRYWN
ncbi:MAG: rhomboid family intramembrane serine protease [Bdellovibrionaceae bacterium]|nr:rhomboid family intramembrane serine protease [Pseudobdellovibrionaceae bacterium]